jgi:hypothetical protein
MAQTGFTPISNYYSATAAAVPTAGNLVAGELAINTADGKLFYKDSSGVVQTIASKAGNLNVSSFSGGTTGLTPSTATTGVITLAGTLAVTNGGTGVTTSTGSTNNVLSTSPTLTTPIIATTMGVGGATPAASGSGITFPATQSASSDANTLDDYEEGTWTPTLTGPTAITYTERAGFYTKIGNMVYVKFNLRGAWVSGGQAVISTLPFTGSAVGGWGGYITYQDNTNTSGIYFYIGGGGNNLQGLYANAQNWVPSTTASAYIYGMATYAVSP